MSLATRCTSCGTVFRVVQDQLKVSEGWVRCGRCNEVFNAIEGLFDLERDAPPNWKPPVAPPAPLAATVSAAFEAQQQPEPPDDDDDVFQLSDGDRIHSRFFQPEQADVEQTPAQAVKARDRVDFADAQFNTALLADGKPKSAGSKGTGIARSSVKEARAKQEAARRGPGFVQQAKHRERWRSPTMRALLSLVSLLLIGTLVGQSAYHFRDLWSAQWPATRPWIAKGCEVLGCQIAAPRRIDDVTVESSGLSPAPGGGSNYRLAVVLRNRGTLPLTMPWIDLRLTDLSGQLVARRALSPSDFRVASSVLAPESESSMQLLLSSTDPRRISSYTVEIFYP